MATEKPTIQVLVKKRIPFAKNGLNSKRLYKQRSLYRQVHQNKGNVIDFWYDKILYGRVDESGNGIFPSEENLKTFKGTDCIYALNFVVDAYEDFVEDFKSQHRLNKRFKAESFLNPTGLRPKRAWISVNRLFHEQVKLIYNGFTTLYLKDPARNRNATSYDKFIKLLLNYLDDIGTNSPLTRTGIITNLFCPPNISGLCVEFTLLDHSADYIKHNNFLMSDFYYSYRDTAVKYGFLIDKNAPWRLVANLDSQEIIPYMRRYGITPENIYKKYYIKSYLLDMPSLQVYLKQFYNSFAAAQPKATRSDGTKFFRERLNDAEFASRYDADYWMRTYARIRQSEVMEKKNENEFSELIKKATNIKKYIDRTAAIDYINKEYLGLLKPPFEETGQNAALSLSSRKTARRGLPRASKKSVALDY